MHELSIAPMRAHRNGRTKAIQKAQIGRSFSLRQPNVCVTSR